MHTWAKRGLQTAAVTGGLLVIGAGIASASENVTPEAPSTPVDLSNTVLGNGPSGVLGGQVADLSQDKAVPVAHALDLGAPSAMGTTMVNTFRNTAQTMGQGTMPAADLDTTQIHGFSGTLFSSDGPGMLPQDAPAGPVSVPATGPAAGAFGQLTQLGQLSQAGPTGKVGSLAAPMLAQVSRTVLNGPGAFPDASTLNLPVGSAGLLKATELPAIPLLSEFSGNQLQSAPALPAVGQPAVQLPEVSSLRGELPLGGQLPGAGALPTSSVASANLPTAGLPAQPSTQSAPAVPAGLPAVPAGLPGGLTLPNLPAVPVLPAAPQLPGRPSTQAGPAGLTVPAVPSLPAAGLPAAGLPTAGLPAAGLPTAGLPASPGLPAAPSLPGVHVPSVPALPTPGMPAIPAPAAPQDAPAGMTLPNLPMAPMLPVLPETSALPLQGGSPLNAAAQTLRTLTGHGLDGIQLPIA
ncbi:MAG TPA: hypothetical protein VHW44_00195 [Pseudonocardiaceae bacterium]|jgi:hypothetical protein|nr:hypothetical protein [Pseudonocardiaceae bacterium]